MKVAHKQTCKGLVEIKTDGRTVWINAASGGLIGRFSRLGIDVHAADMGVSNHCCDCRPTPEEGAWPTFVASMQKWHSITLPAIFQPEWCK